GRAARWRDVLGGNDEGCTRDTELRYAARMMAERDAGAIPVVESTDMMKPIGIITARDIAVRVVAKGQDPATMRVGGAMSSGVVTIDQNARLEECVQLMERRQIRRVVVVDAGGRC